MRLIFLSLFSLNLFALDIDDLRISFEEDGAFVTGKILTKLNNGLHFLEKERDFQNTLLIAIHGRATEGYEWVYPLINLDKKNNRISFYRWNTIGCPNEAIRKISLEIDRLKERYKKIVLVGHSYGGLVVSKILTDDFNSKVEGHFVAAPLKGNFLIRTFCGYTPPRKINENNLGFNWMTIKELDGEFRNLKSDPQLLEIEGVVAKRLPEEYNGNRLGHNWSISWLTDHLNSKQN